MSKKFIKFAKRAALVMLFVSTILFLLFVALKDYKISEVFQSKRYWGTCLALSMILSIIPNVFSYRKNISNENREVKKYNAYQTDIKNIKGIKRTKLTDALKCDFGIIVGIEETSKREKKETRLTLADGSRAILFCNDSEKRERYLDNSIAFLSARDVKPDLYIKTVNERNFLKHKIALSRQGYKTYIFNLRDTFKSDRWNPFEEMVKDMDTIREIKQKLECKDGKYVVAEHIYNTYKDARDYAKLLNMEIYEKAKNFAKVMISDEKAVGCRTLLVAFILAFCEDYIDGKIRKEQINLYNLKRNIVRNSKNIVAVKQYLIESRDDDSAARTVLRETDDKVLSAMLLTTARIFNNRIDDSVKVLTSDTDVDLEGDKNPVAVFIVEPDGKSKTCGIGKLILQRITRRIKDNSGKRAAVLFADYTDSYLDTETIGLLGEFEGDFITVLMSEYETCKTETAMMNYKAKSDMRIYMHFDKHSQESELSAFCNTDFEKVLKQSMDNEDAMVFYKDNSPFIIGMGKDVFAEINRDMEPVFELMPTKRCDVRKLGFDISEIINGPNGGDLNM